MGAHDDGSISCYDRILDHGYQLVSHPLLALMLSAASHRNAALFPRLEELELSPRTDDSATLCRELLSPSLRTLRLRFKAGFTLRLIQLLAKLVLQCPNLQSLHISTHVRSRRLALVASLSTALRSLNNLTTLAIPTNLLLHADIWDAIANLPSLAKIGIPIFLDSANLVSFPQHISQRGLLHGFTALHYLELEVTSNRLVKLFTNGVNAPINHITIHTIEPHLDSALEDLLTAIGNEVPHLTSICLRYFTFPRNLGVLLDLHGLTRLAIHLQGAFVMTNKLYRAIATAMPMLISLVVQPKSRAITPPQATLQALSDIATHCHDICSLSLFLDPTGGPYKPTRFGPSLQEICFGSSTPVADQTAHKLARYFQRPMPRVVRFVVGGCQHHWSDWFDENQYRNWVNILRDVEHHLPTDSPSLLTA